MLRLVGFAFWSASMPRLQIARRCDDELLGYAAVFLSIFLLLVNFGRVDLSETCAGPYDYCPKFNHSSHNGFEDG